MTSVRFLSISSLLTVVIATGIACSRPAQPSAPAAVPTAPASPPYESVTLTLPPGDAQAGRTAFLVLKCTDCHRVEGEKEFPAPIGGSQGPDLDRTLKLRPASELATAIIVPSHSMSLRTSDELRARLAKEELSPMGDFSRAMTVRQLVDLIAYLQAL